MSLGSLDQLRVIVTGLLSALSPASLWAMRAAETAVVMLLASELSKDVVEGGDGHQ